MKVLYNVTYFSPRLRLALVLAGLLPVGMADVKRTQLLRRFGFDIATGVRVLGSPRILLPWRTPGNHMRNLHLQAHASLAEHCVLALADHITIETRARIAHDVTILTGTHTIGPAADRMGPLVSAPVTIGAGAWIGARAIIMPGVTIGAGAVVAAGAVVFHSVPDNALVVGNPARVVKTLDPAGEYESPASATGVAGRMRRLVQVDLPITTR
jgi:acetyltransferase-like isoleucine patch superfamily enzyme